MYGLLVLALATASAAAATEPAARPQASTHVEDTAADGFLMPAVTVLERKGFDPQTGAGSSIRVTETRSRIQSASELLAHEPGVSVRRSGGLYGGVSIRGGAANQVQLFINGVPLPSGLAGAVAPGILPLDAVDRIDIYRGGIPVRYARSPLSGAIDVVTLSPDRAPTAGRLAAGSFGAREAAAFTSFGGPDGGLLAGLAYRGAQGDFPYENNNGTPLNRDDDRVDARRNNDYTAADLFVTGEARTGSNSFRGHLLATGANQGLPGFGFNQTDRARLDSRIMLGGGEWRFAHGAGNLGIAAFGGLLRERFRDPRGELSVPRTNTLNDARQMGLRAAEQLEFGRLTPELTIELESMRFDTETATGDGARFGRHRASAAMGFTHRGSALTLLVGLQAEYDLLTADQDAVRNGVVAETVDAEHWLPAARIGAAYDVAPSFTLLANVGSGYRAPSVYEQLGDRGLQIGNPALEPERAVYLDAGFQWRRETRRAQWLIDARYFVQRIRDIIGVYQTTSKTTSAMNFSSALAAGYETSARLLAASFEVGLNAAYTGVVNTGGAEAYAGKQLPGRPRWEVGGDLAYTHRFARPFYSLDAQGGYYLDPANTPSRRIDARHYHTAGLSVTPLTAWRITGTIENFTDERSYDYVGFPLPGRKYGLVAQFTSN